MSKLRPKRLIIFSLLMAILIFAASGYGPCVLFVIQARLGNQELKLADTDQIVRPSSSQLTWAFNAASRELTARHGPPTACRISTTDSHMEKGMTWHQENKWLTLEAIADLSANWITVNNKPLNIPSASGAPFSTTQNYSLDANFFDRFP